MVTVTMLSLEHMLFNADYGCAMICTVGNRWQHSWNMTIFPVDYHCYLSVSLICGGNELSD